MKRILILLVAALFLVACGSDDKEELPATGEVEQEGKRVVEVNQEIELDNIKLEIQNVYVEDGELSFGYWWSHWASNDKVHFSAFAYPVVSQNGEELEQEDKKDSLLKQTEKGVDSRVELQYELQDDSPVEIKFKTTSDDPQEESFEVDIK